MGTNSNSVPLTEIIPNKKSFYKLTANFFQLIYLFQCLCLLHGIERSYVSANSSELPWFLNRQGQTGNVLARVTNFNKLPLSPLVKLDKHVKVHL